MNSGRPRRSRHNAPDKGRRSLRGPLWGVIQLGRERNPRGWERLLRWLSAVALALTAFGCVPASAMPAVALVVRTGNDWERFCGAVAIGPRTLLTARHCLRGGTSVAYVTREVWEHTSDGAYMAHVVRQSKARDLAWLRTYGPAFESWLPLRGVERGETVAAIAPIADWRGALGTTGDTFTAFQTPDSILPSHTASALDGSFRASTLSVQPGWSGSPVLGGDGALVGIVIGCSQRYELSTADDGRGLVFRPRCRPHYTIIAPVAP